MLVFLKMILAINSSKANGQNSPRIHKCSKCCDFISLLRKDVVPSVADGVATEYNLRTPCPESLGIIALDSRITQKIGWGPFTYDVTRFGGFLTPPPSYRHASYSFNTESHTPAVRIGRNRRESSEAKINQNQARIMRSTDCRISKMRLESIPPF